MNQPPPYGQYPQQPPPGYPPVQQFGQRPYVPPPSPRGGLPLAMMIRLGVAGVAIVVAAGAFLFAKYKMSSDAKAHIVFENSTSASVDLQIDGKSKGTIAAGKALVLAVDAGEHDVVAGSDKGHISVPKTDNFRGLYAVGGKSLVAVVTAHYSESKSSFGPKDSVTPVEFKGGSRLATLQYMSVDSMELDKPFPETVSSNNTMIDTAVTHLCHIHETEDDYVGCPNF